MCGIMPHSVPKELFFTRLEAFIGAALVPVHPQPFFPMASRRAVVQSANCAPFHLRHGNMTTATDLHSPGASALPSIAESTSSMPARDWQCRGQSLLLLVMSKDNVILHSYLCSNGCGTDLVMNMTCAYPPSQCSTEHVTSNTHGMSSESTGHK